MAEAVIDIVLSNGQKAGATLKELQQSANRLKREINDLTPGSEAWVKKTGDFQKVTGRLGDLRGELKGVKEEQDNLTSSFLKIVPFGGQIEQLGGQFNGFKSNIGGVTSGFKTLKTAIAATGIGLLVVALTAVVTWFSKTEKGIKIVSAAMSGLEAVTGSVIGVINRLFTEPKALMEDFGNGIKEFILSRFELALKGIMGFGTAFKKIMAGDFSEGLKDAGQALLDFTRGTNPLVMGIEAIGTAAVGMGKDVKDAFMEGFELERAKQNLKELEREINLSVSASKAIFDIQSAIADDATRSFAEREQAARNARAALEDTAAAEKRIAAERFRLAEMEFKMNERNGTLNDDLRNAYVEAQIAKQEADTNYTRTLIDNEKQIAELKQDRLERDLDILIDGFDNVKTVNERIIADDTRTFEERQRMLADLKKLSDDSFAEQIKTIEQFTDKAVDANDLLATSDAKLLNEKIRSLGLSEIIEGRLLEIVRERRIATQDLADLETDLNNEQRAAEEQARADKLAREQAEHQAKMEAMQLNFEEEQLLIEGKRMNDLLTEEEYQMEMAALQTAFLQAQLQEKIAYYGAGSAEARKAQMELDKFLQESYKKDQEAFKRSQQQKRQQFFSVTNALSGAATDFFQLQIDAEKERLETQKASLKEGQSLRASEYNKLKKQQRAQAYIAGITEIANIWSSVMQLGPIAGPILGAILTALAIARTSANLQKIDSQKFGSGGRIQAARRLAMGGMLRGPLHRDGGIPGVVKSTGQPIEMEGGEIVLTRRVGMDPAGLAAASELNARYGGVKFFQTGGPINPIAGGSAASSAASASSSRAEELAAATLERLDMLNNNVVAQSQQINEWQTNLKVNNNVGETREGINVINKLEDDAAF